MCNKMTILFNNIKLYASSHNYLYNNEFIENISDVVRKFINWRYLKLLVCRPASSTIQGTISRTSSETS